MLKKQFISFKKGYKRDFSKTNKFIFVLMVFLLQIEKNGVKKTIS